MWIADNWKDYEVLDTSRGEKLERWGEHILIRPDPQVLWNTDREHPGWKSWQGHYHRSAKGGGEWEFRKLPEEWQIGYETALGRELRFNLKPFSFKHTGLFPEQAANWDWAAGIIKSSIERSDKGSAEDKAADVQNPFGSSGSGQAKSPKPFRVLNLFAYTGGATISAAAAGANVTHVDASKGMVSWAKENAVSSKISDTSVRWLVDDCMKFVQREIRRGNKYEGIILDPPSYGRGPKGEIWKLEDCIYELVAATASLLYEGSRFYLLNSYTTGLQPSVMLYMVADAIQKRFGGSTVADELCLPVTASGLYLPCGASCRWTSGRE